MAQEIGKITTITDSQEAMDFLAGMKSSEVSKPTLAYLDLIGIGYAMRTLFHVVGQDFDDVRISLSAWLGFTGPGAGKEGQKTAKMTTTNHHLPLYVDEDVELGQMTVILRYLGKKHGLWADNTKDELQLEQIMVQCYDMIFHFTGIFQPNQLMIYGPKPEEYHKAQLQSYMKKPAGYYFKNLTVMENYLSANKTNSGFLVGEKLTVVDLLAFSILCFWYKCWDADVFMKDFPKLEEYIQKIGHLEKIKEYNETKKPKFTWLHGQWGGLGHCQRYGSEDGHQNLLSYL